MRRLGYPHKKIKFIHVAGTNGKGSVCAMSASVLSNAGYKTGLHTSPYINNFKELMQINGENISGEKLAEITEFIRREADKMSDHPTEYELIMAVACLYFLEEKCDIALLEVGLGGRLDYTNIIPVPEAAVITPVNYDHMHLLGNTIEEIAREKAGIIKPGGTIVSSPQLPGAESVLRCVCGEQGADIYFIRNGDINISRNTTEGQDFSYKNYNNLNISLLGRCQTQNAAAVIEITERLREKGWKIPGGALRKGLEKTKWPARFEILRRSPWVIVDGAHNAQCADILAENLREYFPGAIAGKQISFLIGVMADKDYKSMFDKIMPIAKNAKKIITVMPDSPRALDPEISAGYFRDQGIKNAISCESPEAGAELIAKGAEKNDVICAFGSLFMSGAVRKAFDSGKNN
jgi:dihydrofolate synthase/folylpolyglutamate synthase